MLFNVKTQEIMCLRSSSALALKDRGAAKAKYKNRRRKEDITGITSTNTRMLGGQRAAANCRFDGSVAVNYVSASCRQSGNFSNAWNVHCLQCHSLFEIWLQKWFYRPRFKKKKDNKINEWIIMDILQTKRKTNDKLQNVYTALIIIVVFFSSFAEVKLHGRQYTRYFMTGKVDDSLVTVDVACLNFHKKSRFEYTTNSYYVEPSGYSYWDDKCGNVFYLGSYKWLKDTIVMNYEKVHTVHASLQDTLVKQYLLYRNDTLFIIDEECRNDKEHIKNFDTISGDDDLISKLLSKSSGTKLENKTHFQAFYMVPVWVCVYNNKEGMQTTDGESDIFILLRGRESRLHGEGICSDTQHAQEPILCECVASLLKRG